MDNSEPDLLLSRSCKWFSTKQFDYEPDCSEDQGNSLKPVTLVLFLISDLTTSSKDTGPVHKNWKSCAPDFNYGDSSSTESYGPRHHK